MLLLKTPPPESISGREEHQQRRLAELERVFGGEIGALLALPDTTEVLVNPDGQIYVDRMYAGMKPIGVKLHPDDTMNAIMTVAGELRVTIDEEHPWLQGELPLDGSRLQAWIPPVVTSPTLVIRKHRRQGVDGVPALRIEDYIRDGAMPEKFADHLRSAVREHLNVLIVGSTSSGKTTFGGAYLNLITALCPDDRIITIEDTFELYCVSPNRVALRESPHASMRLLLQHSLRARPDRIIFGEVRNEAAHDLVMAWNTGHNGGFCTIHGNGIADAFDRLETLVELAGYPLSPRRIANAVQIIVCMRRAQSGARRVEEFAYVRGWKNGEYQLERVSPL
jgi:P-type conjugative transfer ATPase TrbB